MEPAGVDLFERLPDELVRNVLDRVLWSPLDFDSVRKKRHLGVVCRRFKRLLPSLEGVDLEINNPIDEQGFRQALSRREDAVALRKLALHIHSPTSLRAILQALLPAPLNSLEEVHLYLDDADPADQVDWHSVLSILQRCQRLTVLHIRLWEAAQPEDPPVDFYFAKPLESFPVLQSLTLFGFTVPPDYLKTFSEVFPALENLELHYYDEPFAYKDLHLSSLKKAYWWGTMQEGLDVLSPETVTVPRSLRMLLGYLRSADAETSSTRLEWILCTLGRMTEIDGAARKAIVLVPHGLRTLVELTTCGGSSIPIIRRRMTALRLLSNLAGLPANRRAIADVPGCLAQLRVSSDHWAEGPVALLLLEKLTLELEVASVVGRTPGMLGYLLSAFDTMDGLDHLEFILLHLTDVAQVRQALARSRVNLKKLAAFLNTRKRVNQQILAAALQLFQRLVETEPRAMVALPRFLEGLVGQVRSALSRGAAGETLSVLAALVADAEACKALGGIDGSLPVLVSVLSSGESWDQLMAVTVLLQLVKLGGEAEAIARLPGCITGLVGLLDFPAYCRDGGKASAAAEILLYFAEKITDAAALSSIRVTMAREPALVSRLVAALDGVGPLDENLPTVTLNRASVNRRLVSVLTCLAEAPENRKVIAAVPGCLEKLMRLVEGMQRMGTFLLSRLMEDPEVVRTFVHLPGIKDRWAKVLNEITASEAQVGASSFGTRDP
ncbi:hypothetical protein KFL_000750340 [Klebsormidium nitens]|uniref:F-box domain-containing protein n=1 Tax=Klebsormidium nitens TaxID=105231 RepID=A0A0U9HKU5_KLENI|nr:hypothetical protein KFL_000750340 [Klebsormidium nitens]|eukprot:GAQ81266.1 hypothetical protein KFL_000750340 [Klebsormidium nitens]